MRNRFFYCITIVFFGILLADTSRAQTQLPCTTIQDPIGDAEIQNATGTFAINTARADLIGASFQPEGGGYVASVSTSQPFLLRDKEKGNIVFMFDVDAVSENNSERIRRCSRWCGPALSRGSSFRSDPSQFVVRRYVFYCSLEPGNRRAHLPRSMCRMKTFPFIFQKRSSRLQIRLVGARGSLWEFLGSGPCAMARRREVQFAGECGYLPVPDLENMSALPDGFQPSSDSLTDIRPGLIALGIYLLLAGILAGVKRFRS
jgi:hypothetical protein